jgi:hypothetical protein
MWKNAPGASSRHPNVHLTTPSRGQPCLVTSLSPKYTRLLHRSSPVDEGFLLLLLVFFPRRPRPGEIRSEPVPRAPHDRHAAPSTAASINRCQTPLAQRVSARIVARHRDRKLSLKSLLLAFFQSKSRLSLVVLCRLPWTCATRRRFPFLPLRTLPQTPVSMLFALTSSLSLLLVYLGLPLSLLVQQTLGDSLLSF